MFERCIESLPCKTGCPLPGALCQLPRGTRLGGIAFHHVMHLSMSSQRGEEAGHRAGFWHFPKHCCQIPYPQAKMWGQISAQGNDLWSRARTKIQISLPPGQQDNSNALPPGQSDRSKSHPIPCLPPPRWLDIDKCINGPCRLADMSLCAQEKQWEVLVKFCRVKNTLVGRE